MILCGMFWLKLLYDKRRNRMDLILVLVIGIFLVILCLMIIRQVILPYKKIENNMTLFLKGYTIDGLQDSEIALTKEVDRIFSELIQLLKSEQMLNENKRQAQYLALQNQINPHFLYNTLESIRSEAMEAGMESVVCMTEALAHFFRYTISNMENMVTLEEELDNINTYFLIQKYRFEERIGLTIEYDEEEHDLLNHCLLPKLTLQPVVENSIIHGIERKMGFSTVRIVLRCTEKRLIIQVSDDGIGMQPEALDDLNRKLNQSLFESLHNKKKKGGIALVNVNNRIHLIFGEEYGMTVYSTPGVGTDVMIELPLVTSRRELKKVDFNKV
ncbi:histidine kinase [Lachnospiraceae bacterium NSJ-46]|uniref:Histidine kinase n=2 Tax=Jingyaoa shaoxingensis TaxID=2763671 RepID=A0ABR7NBL9_9FIRM|nr:histidine kinase [Jingyaoa shaoxingensis]